MVVRGVSSRAWLLLGQHRCRDTGRSMGDMMMPYALYQWKLTIMLYASSTVLDLETDNVFRVRG